MGSTSQSGATWDVDVIVQHQVAGLLNDLREGWTQGHGVSRLVGIGTSVVSGGMLKLDHRLISLLGLKLM